MVVKEELEKLIESNAESIDNFEITYKNGGKVIGAAKKIKFKPLRITILKDPVPKGESKKHSVVFDHVTNLKVCMKDGSVNNYN